MLKANRTAAHLNRTSGIRQHKGLGSQYPDRQPSEAMVESEKESCQTGASEPLIDFLAILSPSNPVKPKMFLRRCHVIG
jgi:hypothetical protein